MGTKKDFDVAQTAYVNRLLDEFIQLRKEQLKKAGESKPRYGEVHVFREVFQDENRASDECFNMCRNVSECHPWVIKHCEHVLNRARPDECLIAAE